MKKSSGRNRNPRQVVSPLDNFFCFRSPFFSHLEIINKQYNIFYLGTFRYSENEFGGIFARSLALGSFLCFSRSVHCKSQLLQSLLNRYGSITALLLLCEIFLWTWLRQRYITTGDPQSMPPKYQKYSYPPKNSQF